MMEDQERAYNPSELEVGMIFDKKELIVENEGGNIATVRNEEGKMRDGREYDMKLLGYTLTPHKSSLKVVLNMEMEIFPDDGVYLDYKNKLKQTELWSEN